LQRWPDLCQQREEQQYSRFDSKSHKIFSDIAVSRRPRDMHFNADHTKLFLACGDNDVIDVLDVASGKVVGKLVTGSSPETFAMDEARRRIYVSDEEASTLAIIDTDKKIIEKEVPTGAPRTGRIVGL
jgi:DNA-binding beta-propeller fold protein YncE